MYLFILIKLEYVLKMVYMVEITLQYINGVITWVDCLVMAGRDVHVV